MITFYRDTFTWKQEDYVHVLVGSVKLSELEREAAKVQFPPFRVTQPFEVESQLTGERQTYHRWGGEKNVHGEVICWTYGTDINPHGYPLEIIKVYNDRGEDDERT